MTDQKSHISSWRCCLKNAHGMASSATECSSRLASSQSDLPHTVHDFRLHSAILQEFGAVAPDVRFPAEFPLLPRMRRPAPVLVFCCFREVSECPFDGSSQPCSRF